MSVADLLSCPLHRSIFFCYSYRVLRFVLLYRLLFKGRAMMGRWAFALMWAAVAILAASFVLTILGSAANLETLLVIGLVGWPVASVLFFAWLIAWMWNWRKRAREEEPY